MLLVAPVALVLLVALVVLVVLVALVVSVAPCELAVLVVPVAGVPWLPCERAGRLAGSKWPSREPRSPV